jgi:hypothetical protein
MASLANNNAAAPTYLPTILAFNYCGEDYLRQVAKGAVETAIRDLSKLFKTTYDWNQRHAVSDFIEQSKSANYVPVPKHVSLGLFLAREIPGVLIPQLNDSNTEVISFQINQHILTMDPEKAWDDYVRSRSSIEEAGAPRVLRESPKPVPKKSPDWPPSEWRIRESLGEGGQGWTFKVSRAGDPDRISYVLKRLKNKERSSDSRAR